MSDVPFSFQSQLLKDSLTRDLPNDPDERIQELTRRSSRAILSLLARYERLARILDSEVGFGYPDNGSGSPRRANIIGAWATVVLTSTNDLGTGSNSPLTFTHSMGLPVNTVPTTGDSYPNVRIAGMTVVRGDRTGANAAPSATANPDHVSVHFLLGDTVTADAIELRVHSDITPSSTHPLTIDLFLTPAVI